MSQQFEKLTTLLKELFQLDRPDLDFGFYRIMHAKSEEITQFLERDLLPQVQEALSQYKSADKAELEKELAEMVAQARKLEVDPDTLPKVVDLRRRIAEEAVDLNALEAEVYDHLYSFFRRYYSEGDFLSKRVYKPGVYAIPYEGEEVKLHWANADQYYIKTDEYLRNYTFRLRPDDQDDPMRVHFRLVDAAEGEHDNVKADENKKRVFLLTDEDFIAEVSGETGPELAIHFEYRLATVADWPEAERAEKSKPPAQKDLISLAEERIRAVSNDNEDIAQWIKALKAFHITANGEVADYSRLRAHLNRYTARNTFDYFIHKDLGSFLRRELDFFIKNEVMHLDDVENETAPRVEQYLSKIKVIRHIAGKIIEFLAQLEDFQKKLWLKKKFVVETSWCIRVGCIPEAFYTEMAANEAQHKEWVKLFGIDEKLNPEFLKTNSTLVVDTQHFNGDFTARLLEAMGDIDEQTDGLLLHGDNFQALSLIQKRYRDQVKCIYIDPPYNTEKDRAKGKFVYKDGYDYSTWLAMIAGRADLAYSLIAENGSQYVSIDDVMYADLFTVLASIFGRTNHIATVIWEKVHTRKNSARHFSVSHDYIPCFARNKDAWDRVLIPRENTDAYTNPDKDPRGPWKPDPIYANNPYDVDYLITKPNGTVLRPPPGQYWRLSEDTWKEKVRTNAVVWGTDDGYPMVKRFLAEVQDGLVPVTLFGRSFAGDNARANAEFDALFGSDRLFSYPKPTLLIQRLLQTNLRPGSDEFALDYFAGSGTTGHAVVNLNREDGSRRKFILVEVGNYFDTVLLPRIKKVTFTPEWKNGKPECPATLEEAGRSPHIVKVVRLESYEDALNNLTPKRTLAQQDALDLPEANGSDSFKEQYLLRYMLDVETRGSQSLLNIDSFLDPTSYRLKVKRLGSDESCETNVDLLETFNWLLGLKVQRIAAPQIYNANFRRDDEGRLQLKGYLKESADGPWWFRAVSGLLPDERRVLILWRKRPGGETPEGMEEDNLVLEEWFKARGFTEEASYDLIYINGICQLETLKAPGDAWEVRLIEDAFRRLMFGSEEV